MPSQELKQAWLMIFAGITGGIMGNWISSFKEGIGIEKWILFFISLIALVYILESVIKHNK